MSIPIITQINKGDNVAIANLTIMKGDVIPFDGNIITAKGEIQPGKKISLTPIKEGELIYKCGYPIGKALSDIKPGEYLSSYNYTQEIPNLEELATTIAEQQEAEIQVESQKWMNYAPRISAFDNYGKTGLKKELVIITDEAHLSLAKEIDKDAKIIVAKAQEKVESIIKHPNLTSALVLGFNLENQENIISFNSVSLKDGQNAYNQLKATILHRKKTSFPLSSLVLEIYGKTDNLYYNHIVGCAIDKLIELGVSVIVDIATPLSKSLPILKAKFADPTLYTSKWVKEVKDCANNQLEKEMNYLNLLGKSRIQNIINGSGEIKKGLNIYFTDEEREEKIINSHFLLDLSSTLSPLILSPILNYEFGKEESEDEMIEAFLFSITTRM